MMISVHVFLFMCCEVCGYSEVAGCNQWRQSGESHNAYQILGVSGTVLRCCHIQHVGRNWADDDMVRISSCVVLG